MLRAQAFWQKSILGELYSRRPVEKKVWTAELERERASMIDRRNLETRVVQKGEFITVSRESSTKKKSGKVGKNEVDVAQRALIRAERKQLINTI